MKIFLLSFILFFCFISIADAQSNGQLDVSVSTSHAGGNYKPRNIIAIWIENSDNQFVKTLLAYANKRKTHLNTWQASTEAAGSGYNTVDAITGATVSSHGTRNCSWDGTDFNGNTLPDGDYKVWMELTDKNSTGNYSSFSFTKGDDQQQLNPGDEPSFSAINILWTPDTSPITSLGADESTFIYPNPVRNSFTLSKTPLLPYQIFDVKGNMVYEGMEKEVNFQSRSQGLYFIILRDENLLLPFIKE